MSLVLSPPEAAELLGVCPNTVRALVRDGFLTDAFAELPLRRIGIPRAEVEALAQSAPASDRATSLGGADVVRLPDRGGRGVPSVGRRGSEPSDGAA